ncbi:MAG: radical SAM protein [Acidobacteriota bacterium]
MKRLTLHLTDRCNLSCQYCYQDRSARGRLCWEWIEKSVRLAFTDLDPRLKIYFYGGEPLLEWDSIVRTVGLVRLLQQESYKEVSYGLTTNGLLLDEERLRFFDSIRTDVLLSLDGDRHSHESGRGAATFDRVCEVIDQVRRYEGIQLRINAVIHPWNVEYLEQSVRFLSSLPVSRYEFLLDSLNPWTMPQLRALARQFRSLYNWCSNEVAAGRSVPFPNFEHGSFKRPYQCSGVRDSWVITPEGKIFDCVMRTPKWRFGRKEEFDRFVLGDLSTNPDELPGNEAAGRIDHLPETADQSHRRSGSFVCRDCRCVNRCVICPSVCQQATGSFLEVPRSQCIFTKLCCYYSDRLASLKDNAAQPGGSYGTRISQETLRGSQRLSR